MSTPQRALLQREAIVEAARQLVTEEGLDALSLRRLAARLGVTAPALYAHVEHKRDLLRALAEGQFEALVARFDAVADLPPLERIRAHGRAYVDHVRENPELFRLMFLFPPDLGPADLPEGIELPGATRAFEAAAAAVAEAAAAGDIESDDPLLASLVMWSAMHGVASILQLGFELPPGFEDRLITEVTDRLLSGYGA